MEKVEGGEDASRGSMKVNVMYRGMVYRVRGIKVLCSVVTAVVILLVAIVGLGIWMLVSAYAEDKAGNLKSNATLPLLEEEPVGREEPSSTPRAIDFNAPSEVLDDASSMSRVPIKPSSEEDLEVNEAVGHFQGVTPSGDATTQRVPAPDPAFGLFGGLLELEDGSTSSADDDLAADYLQPSADGEVDSVVNPSFARPVVVPPPTADYDFAHSTGGGREGAESHLGYPLQGGLPENMPRDIDPALLEMGLPFPYPPSLPAGALLPFTTPRAPRRPSKTRGGTRRVPLGNRRRQQSLRPEIRRYGVLRGPLVRDLNEGAQVLAGLTVPPGIIPPGLTLPKGVTIPDNLEGLRVPEGVPMGPRGYFEDMMYYYNEHERKKQTSTPPSEKRYSQRKGLTDDDGGYSGPPVVGYGDRIHTTERRPDDPVFQHFWDVYNHDGRAPAEHEDRGPVPEDVSSDWQRPPSGGPAFGGPGRDDRRPLPSVRGSQTDGYPLPVRPDAERPPVQTPDRKLRVVENPRPLEGTTNATRNHRPFLGPLYNIYDYSRRLASTLLSFPAEAGSQFDASREEYMQNEVELLEDYNRVFQQPGTSGEDVLPDMFDGRPGRNERLMLPDSERLRSLSPFELSLVTWTFLDFWEFLIEKVGTLTEEDLLLLEARLERLRLKKDRVLTQNFVAATVNHVSEDTARGFSEVSRVLDVARDFEALPRAEGASSGDDALEGRMWDPLGVFSSEERVKFMQFAVRVLFNFGRVYLKKPYALDCTMLLFCKDLNANAKQKGMEGVAAKIKSVGLKVLTEREDRQIDTMGEIWRSLTAWETLQCDVMFPKCDGPKALEIVNEVALGSRK